MIRSWSPSMVIITTPTGCPSAAATHSAQTDSSGSLRNRTMVSRSLCKPPAPTGRMCLIDASAAARTRGRCFSDLASAWSTRPGAMSVPRPGRPETFCPLARCAAGPRSRELSAYLQRLTDFHSTIPVERDRIPRSIRGAYPVVADDLGATILLEPARLGRPNTVWHGLEPLPHLLPRHHDGQRMANGSGA